MGGSRSCLDEQLSHVLPGCAGGRLAPKSLSDARVVRFPNRFPRNEGERPSKREEWKQEEDRCYYRWIRVGLKIPKQHGPKEQQNENSDSGIAGRAVHNADHDKDRSRKRPALLQYGSHALYSLDDSRRTNCPTMRLTVQRSSGPLLYPRHT